MTTFALKYRLERRRQPFRWEAVNAVPANEKGVYALWLPSGLNGSRECVYVGKSRICVRDRLLNHIQGNEPNPLLRLELEQPDTDMEFSFVITSTDAQTDALARDAIQTLRPRANRP